MTLQQSLGVLRTTAFRGYWIGQTASRFGSGLVPVTTVFAVLDLTGSATSVGLVLAVGTVAEIAALLIGGVWADQFRRRTVMLAADGTRAVSQTVLALLLASGHATMTHLLVLTAVHGAGQGLFRPAAAGIIPDLVHPDQLHQANSLSNISNSAAGIVGPAVAGLLVTHVGFGVVFLADAATFVVSVVCLLLIHPAERPARERRPFFTDLREGWLEITRHNWLWVQMLWDASNLFFVVAPLVVLGPLIAQESLGGAAAWGTVLACLPFGSVVGGLLALRWQPRRPLVAAALILAPGYAAPAAALALGTPLVVVAGAEFLSGLAVTIALTNWTTALQHHVAPDKLSRVSSNDILLSSALLPLGYAAAGPVSGSIGATGTLWVSVAWTLTTAPLVLCVPSIRGLRFVPRDESGPVPVPVTGGQDRSVTDGPPS
ncbi:MFS transporter [Streptomyces sp. NBC_00820]|uniref:MFS transporter n=1 Tax=Streptomyces sp. NBC_00820 TaxID=2975842 RepID=UPI002ED573CA|nr:MFS transporter [Streptomyces sp. NBC_00820]